MKLFRFDNMSRGVLCCLFFLAVSPAFQLRAQEYSSAAVDKRTQAMIRAVVGFDYAEYQKYFNQEATYGGSWELETVYYGQGGLIDPNQDQMQWLSAMKTVNEIWHIDPKEEIAFNILPPWHACESKWGEPEGWCALIQELRPVHRDHVGFRFISNIASEATLWPYPLLSALDFVNLSRYADTDGGYQSGLITLNWCFVEKSQHHMYCWYQLSRQVPQLDDTEPLTQLGHFIFKFSRPRPM